MSELNNQYFLPVDYRRQLSAVAANCHQDGASYWGAGRSFNARYSQWAVYQHARALASRKHCPVIWDVGCGVGLKLSDVVGSIQGAYGVGFDQPYAIAQAINGQSLRVAFRAADLSDFDAASEPSPDVIVCADVIEHLANPSDLLARLRSSCSPKTAVVISTPDRHRLHGEFNRSPVNPMHVQEWNVREFRQLVNASGFQVESVQHFAPTKFVWSARCIRLYLGLVAARASLFSSMCFELKAG